MAAKALAHQRDAGAFLDRRNGSGCLFMEPGLGKTRVVLDQAKKARRTLVWAPLNPVEFVWPEEHAKWAGDLSFNIVRGTPKERARILFDEKPDIAVINYDLARWFYDEVRQRRKMPYDLLALDEGTAVKNTQSVAHRGLFALRDAFDGIIEMSGTPAENSLVDLFGQLRIVDGGQALGEKVGVFRERYCKCVRQENYVKWVVMRAQELREAAAPLCFVRRATDCLDMPALIFRDVHFELSPSERKFYDFVRKKHVVPIKEKFALDNTGVMFDKLRQICSGFVYDEERIAHAVGMSKARALQEVVDESYGQPMLVGFWYQGSKAIIRKQLGYDVPAIDRFTSTREKKRLLDEWRRGNLPVLLGQVKTVALGLNMQSPRASVTFYDLPWSHGQHWQFIRRIWRQGQQSNVIVRRLMARSTVDPYVAGVLKRKQVDENDLLSFILKEEMDAI